MSSTLRRLSLLLLGSLLLACGEETKDSQGEPQDTALPDEDGDGFTAALDCDDSDPEVHPDAEERCDGLDNDCDGAVDEDAIDMQIWYADTDGDGYGDEGSPSEACEQPSGTVYDSNDCDDSDAAINPDADEVCGDGLDNNCEGTVDGEEAIDANTWFADADGDGHGDKESQTLACDQPSGFTDMSDDCDDSDADAYPENTEICGDGIDNDCQEGDQACGLYGEILLDEVPQLQGEAAGDQAGGAVAGPGDINDDGRRDMLIGASGADSSTGKVYLVYGPLTADIALSSADAILRGDEAGDAAGTSISGAGDVDGDSLPDLLVGAPGTDEGGTVYLVLSPPPADLRLPNADTVISATELDQHFGASVAGVGNLNQDASSDLAIGAPDGAEGGSCYLFLGPVSGAISASTADGLIQATDPDASLGDMVAGVGDVDGDGNDDLFLGSPGDNTSGSEAGAALLFLGPITGSLSASDADLFLKGEDAGHKAGSSVSSAGDVDGDGLPDLLVGAPAKDRSGETVGAAYLILGGSTGTQNLKNNQARIRGDANGDRAGGAVAAAGDPNEDGFDDILVGAAREDGMGQDSGMGFLLLGPVSGEYSAWDADSRYLGTGEQAYAGAALCGLGDIDASSFDDLLVGSPGADGLESGAGAAFLILGGPSSD